MAHNSNLQHLNTRESGTKGQWRLYSEFKPVLGYKKVILSQQESRHIFKRLVHMEQKRKKNDQRYERKRTGMRNILRHRDMVWHTYNPSTWEEVQVQHHPYITDSMSLKPAWVYGTVKEIKKGKRKEKERRKGVRKEGKDCIGYGILQRLVQKPAEQFG